MLKKLFLSIGWSLVCGFTAIASVGFAQTEVLPTQVDPPTRTDSNQPTQVTSSESTQPTRPLQLEPSVQSRSGNSQNTLDLPPASEILLVLERQSQQIAKRGRSYCVAIHRVRREAETSLYWNETFGGAAFGEAISIPILAPKPTDPDFLPTQYGCGVILDASTGLILTVATLIDADATAFDYYVTFSQPNSDSQPNPNAADVSTSNVSRTFPATVIGRDPRSGLAVLRTVNAAGETISLSEYGGQSIPLESRTAIPVAAEPAEMGAVAAESESAAAELPTVADGSFVVVLGNPLAMGRDGQLSVSLGTLSNHARRAAPEPIADQPSGKQTLAQYGTLLTTDIPFVTGREGGPLFDLSGRFLGLVLAPSPLPGVVPMETSAIPVDAVFLRAVRALREGREVGYGVLGVEMKNTESHHVRVHRVLNGVPAQSAGIQMGDLLVALDGRRVSDADAVVKRLAAYASDATVRLTVERTARISSERSAAVASVTNGQTNGTQTASPSVQRLDVEVPLIQLPVTGQLVTRRDQWRGVEVTASTVANPSVLRGLGRYYVGAAISRIVENSPASQAGFQRGMLITGLAISNATAPMFHEIRTREDFESLVPTIPDDASVTIRLAAENDQTLLKTLGP